MATTEQASAQPDILETETQRQSKLLVEAPKPDIKPEPKEKPVDYQKVADRLGNELGELRAQNKELMRRLEGLADAQKQPEPIPSYSENPEEFIRRTVADAITTQVQPSIEHLTQYQTYQQTQAFQAELSKGYPDWQDTVSSQEFQDWVKASPTRIRMYGDAQAFDLDAAGEMLRRYADDQAKVKAEKGAALGAAHLTSGGAAMDSGKKVFKASEIQRMMQNDQNEYQRWLRNEGLLAYREGRVIKDL